MRRAAVVLVAGWFATSSIAGEFDTRPPTPKARFPTATITAPEASAATTGTRDSPPVTGGTRDGPPTGGPRRGDDVGTPGGTSEGPRGGSRDGGSRDGGGGRRSHDNWVPTAIVGVAAIAAIGTLIANERAARAQNIPPQDQLVDRLLAEGPMLATTLNMSAFAVRGFVRGNWPLLIDFEQRSPGRAKLQISARDVSEIFEYDLSAACPPPRRCVIQMRLPVEIFGDPLRPAVIAATATDAQGKQTQPEFNVYALGAGPRAIGSVAIDQVSFGPPVIRVADRQNAVYRFFSHSDFSNTSVEVWKVDYENDGARLFLVDDRLIDGGVRKDHWVGLNERRAWDGTEKGTRVSSGPHKVQVRAWDRVGDWITAWSNDIVTVEE